MRFSLPFSYGMWTTPEGVNLAKRRGEEEGEKELLRNFRTEQESLAQDYANSLKALGQARQEPIPLRQPTQTEAGLTMLADLLRNITSTVPESQRQQQPSGLQMLRGLREDERTRLQDAERMRAENQRNALLADAQAQELRYNAGAAKLTAAQRATEFAGGRTDLAAGRLQQGAEFRQEQGRLKAAQAWREKVEQAQIDESKLPVGARMAREEQGFIDAGFSPEKAREWSQAGVVKEAAEARLSTLKAEYEQAMRDGLPVADIVKQQRQEWADTNRINELRISEMEGAAPPGGGGGAGGGAGGGDAGTGGGMEPEATRPYNDTIYKNYIASVKSSITQVNAMLAAVRDALSKMNRAKMDADATPTDKSLARVYESAKRDHSMAVLYLKEAKHSVQAYMGKANAMRPGTYDRDVFDAYNPGYPGNLGDAGKK